MKELNDGWHGDDRNAAILQDLQAVHAFALPLPGIRAAEGEASFARTMPAEAPAEWGFVKDDLADFFQRMRCPLGSAGEDGSALVLRREPGLAAGCARARVTPGRLLLEASDLRGIWRAVAWMEHEMAWRHAPILPLGEKHLAPRYDVRISTSAFARGLESFTDEYAYTEPYLRSMAHYGYSAFFVYFDLLAMIKSRLLPELNATSAERELAALQELLERAARYGLEVYLLPAGPRLPSEHAVFQAHPEVRGGRVMGAGLHALCPSAALTRAFYAEQMTLLCARQPALGGLLFIIGGEGFVHCYTRPNPRTERITNCPVCARQSAPEILAPMCNEMTAAIRAASPATRPVWWPYGSRIWQDQPAEDYAWDLDLELIARLDPRAAWLLQLEQDAFVEVPGVGKVLVYDYSIQHIGPSPRFELESAAACRRGLEVAVKTETTQTIELFSLPYIPVMQRWAARHRALRASPATLCLDTWRLNGFWQAPSCDIAYWYSDATPPTDEEIPRRVAVRLYGPAAAAEVLAGWQCFSDAWEHCYARYGTYWDGPLFLGPAHPFDIGTCHLSRAVYSDAFYHHSPGLREHGKPAQPRDPWHRRPKFHLMPGRWAPARLRDYGRACRYWSRGMQHLEKAFDLTPEPLKARARSDLDMAAMVGLYLQADLDFHTFTRLRDTLNYTFVDDPAYRKLLQEMEVVLARNLDGSRGALDMLARTPFIGWGYTFGVRCNAAMVEEKIRHTEKLLAAVRRCIRRGAALLV